jgi:hypothetical protein
LFQIGFGIVLEKVIKGTKEVFPVFAWSLFERIPNTEEDYAIRVLIVGSEELRPPRYFEESGFWFDKDRSSLGYSDIQRLGAAFAERDADRVARIRALLERRYFAGAGTVRYELVRRSFDPVDRWRSGRFKSARSLAVFERSGK